MLYELIKWIISVVIFIGIVILSFHFSDIMGMIAALFFCLLFIGCCIGIIKEIVDVIL